YSPAAYSQRPYLFQALEQTVFAPTMTMLIRSLAELIALLPADESGAPAGPLFYLSPEVLDLLSRPTDPIFLDINFQVTNLEPVKHKSERVIDNGELLPALKPRFQYLHQNVWRMMANLQFIYENGIYKKFVNLPSCPQDEPCS